MNGLCCSDPRYVYQPSLKDGNYCRNCGTAGNPGCCYDGKECPFI
jgi:hypothetical protein